MSYWWCLQHKAVEGDGEDRDAVRLGPYATRAEAEGALEHVADRNAAFDAEDRKWRGDGP